MFRRILSVAAPICVALTGCNQKTESSQPAEMPMVTVSVPVQKEVTEFADYNGRTDAVESVEIRARVTGYLAEILFKAGKEVKKDELLFVIDERPFKAELDRAESQIKLGQAKQKFAEAEVKRNEPLVQSGVTTKAEFEKLVADRDQAAAAVDAAKAAAEVSRLNLKFCRVLSPIDGRISRTNLTVGNLVVADNTLLTSVVSQDPMYVYFNVDEPTMLRVQQLIREGKFKSSRESDKVPIAVGLANEPGRFPHEGFIDFVDNKVDPSTGTLKVRGVLPNPVVSHNDRVFSSGLFVRVQMPLGGPQRQILVSERALGSDQGQKFLFVIVKRDGKSIVEYRPVAVGPAEKGGLRVVFPVKLVRDKDELRLAKPDEMSKAEDSIKPGDLVVVNGLQRIRPGMEVQINEVPMPTHLPLMDMKDLKPASH